MKESHSGSLSKRPPSCLDQALKPFGFLVGPPLFGALASFLGLPAALSLVIVFGLIIANGARRAVASREVQANLREP